MVALALDTRDGYRVSDIELAREGPSFTVDTLRQLASQGWRPSQLFFIIGADAFAEIATWRAYPEVLDAANFAVLTRPGTALDAAFARAPELRARARQPGDMLTADGTTHIYTVDARTRDVSSTHVRARLAAHEAVDGLLPEAVVRHIRANGLYAR
jgi:nicotinate-nucleotide adenylyltransferase